MYHVINSGVFASKYLRPETMYEISYAPMCIRIAPYTGGQTFNSLRWSQNEKAGSLRVHLPLAALKGSGIGNKVYAYQEGDTFYLVDKHCRIDPRKAKYCDSERFTFLPPPDESFFEEAEKQDIAAMYILKSKKYSTGGPLFVMPKPLAACLELKNGNDMVISVFDYLDRRWLEIRKAGAVTSLPVDSRLSSVEFIPQLSGITVQCKFDRTGLMLCDMTFPGWDIEHLHAWYSKSRNAVIVEDKPTPCAVCGAPIRTLALEHFKANVCHSCQPHLGVGNAIDSIASVKKVKKVVDSYV